MRLTRPMYPNGKCCLVVQPELAKEAVVRLIYYRTFRQNYTRTQVRQFRMFLSDRESSSYFRPYKFNIDGEKLISHRAHLGYVEYKLKISEEFHLSDDPLYPCERWNPGEYEACHEKYFLQKTLHILNCTPPWMTQESWHFILSNI